MAQAAKNESKFNSRFASFVIPLCLIAGICIYVFVLGDKGNFQGNDTSNEPVSEGIRSAFGLMYKGGYVVPLLLTLVIICITFSIERFITINKASGKVSAQDFVQKIRTQLNSGTIDGAIKECDIQKGSLANVVRATLVKYQEMEKTTGLDVEQKILAIQKEVEESTTLELPTLERNLVIIATLASVSTLVALFGTVLGMIKAFAALATGGAPDSVALANGISEALINTALGIGNSAIAIIMYNVFTTRIDSITYAIDEASYSIINTFAAKNK